MIKIPLVLLCFLLLMLKCRCGHGSVGVYNSVPLNGCKFNGNIDNGCSVNSNILSGNNNNKNGDNGNNNAIDILCPTVQCPACVCNCNNWFSYSTSGNINGTGGGNDGSGGGNNGTGGGNNGTGGGNNGSGGGNDEIGGGNDGSGGGNNGSGGGNNGTGVGNNGTGGGNDGSGGGNNGIGGGNNGTGGGTDGSGGDNGTNSYDPLTSPCTKCCSYCNHLTAVVLGKNETIDGTVFANLASALTDFVVKVMTGIVLTPFLKLAGTNGNQTTEQYVESKFGEARGEFTNCTYSAVCSLLGVVFSNSYGFDGVYTPLIVNLTDNVTGLDTQTFLNKVLFLIGN